VGQLCLQRFRRRRHRLVAGVFVAHSLGEGSLPVGPFLRQLERVLCRGQLEAQLAQLALPAETPVLGRLNFGPRDLELCLRSRGQLARLCQLSLERLGLADRAAMRIASFAPFLPHDAAAQKLEPRRRFRSLAGGCGLRAHHLEARLDLRF